MKLFLFALLVPMAVAADTSRWKRQSYGYGARFAHQQPSYNQNSYSNYGYQPYGYRSNYGNNYQNYGRGWGDNFGDNNQFAYQRQNYRPWYSENSEQHISSYTTPTPSYSSYNRPKPVSTYSRPQSSYSRPSGSYGRPSYIQPTVGTVNTPPPPPLDKDIGLVGPPLNQGFSVDTGARETLPTESFPSPSVSENPGFADQNAQPIAPTTEVEVPPSNHIIGARSQGSGQQLKASEGGLIPIPSTGGMRRGPPGVNMPLSPPPVLPPVPQGTTIDQVTEHGGPVLPPPPPPVSGPSQNGSPTTGFIQPPVPDVPPPVPSAPQSPPPPPSGGMEMPPPPPPAPAPPPSPPSIPSAGLFSDPGFAQPSNPSVPAAPPTVPPIPPPPSAPSGPASPPDAVPPPLPSV